MGSVSATCLAGTLETAVSGGLDAKKLTTKTLV